METSSLENVIEVTDLWRRYRTGGRGDGFDAVRGVSFTVGRGELFALLGTNGAGKTSTLEVLEGHARPMTPSAHLAALARTEFTLLLRG